MASLEREKERVSKLEGIETSRPAQSPGTRVLRRNPGFCCAPRRLPGRRGPEGSFNSPLALPFLFPHLSRSSLQFQISPLTLSQPPRDPGTPGAGGMPPSSAGTGSSSRASGWDALESNKRYKRAGVACVLRRGKGRSFGRGPAHVKQHRGSGVHSRLSPARASACSPLAIPTPQGMTQKEVRGSAVGADPDPPRGPQRLSLGCPSLKQR